MKRLSALGCLPFVIVAINCIELDFLRINPDLQKRECVVYHENAPVHLKCREKYEQECPYFHSC
jgi:hypothetical protein